MAVRPGEQFLHSRDPETARQLMQIAEDKGYGRKAVRFTGSAFAMPGAVLEEFAQPAPAPAPAPRRGRPPGSKNKKSPSTPVTTGAKEETDNG